MTSLLLTTHRFINTRGMHKSSLLNQSVRSYRSNATIDRYFVQKWKTRLPTGIGNHNYVKSLALGHSPVLSAAFMSDIHIGSTYQHQQSRYISFSSVRLEQASSKVEETVKKIQEKGKEKGKESVKALELDASATATAAPATTPADVAPAKSVDKRTIRQKIWHEVLHYYHGFRLLFIDMNVARKLVVKVLRGHTLTRREYRLLIRTTGDVFRLLPFSVFIIVPFMELLLPVFIKLFPGMLPSTFQTAKDKEVKALNNLKIKLEMAKFLQKTLDEMDVQHKDHSSEEAREFIKFFNRLRSSGGYATSEEIMKFSKLFEDEITLDSLSRPQLTAICKVLEVGSLGTNNFLRFQLRMKLRNLAADDRMIQREGVKALTLAELQSACRARGMRAYGVSELQLKSQLEEWINLSLNEKVPPSLLLLSRAMMLPENVPTAEKLKASISVLPQAAAIQTKAAIGEREGKIDNATQIEIIRDEERKIKEELEELKEVQTTTQSINDNLVDAAKVITSDDGIVLSNKDIEVVTDALHAISKDNKTHSLEKEEIRDLKEEIADYKEDVAELQEVVKTADPHTKIRESHGSKRLLKKVDSMISRLDKVLEDLEKQEKKLQAETIGDEVKHPELIQIDEVMNAIRKMQTVSDESKMQQIYKMLGKIDDDKDGQIKIDDVLEIIETIGKDNVHLSSKHLDEIIELITKEEHLENEEKIEKAIAKSMEEQQQKLVVDSADQSVEELSKTTPEDEKHILTAPEELDIIAQEVKGNKKIDERTIAETIIRTADETAERRKDDILPPKGDADVTKVKSKV